VHDLETSSTDLREKLETYEGSMKQLEEFQDNLMRPLETRLAEIDADFTRCCMRFQKSFHSHLFNVIAGRRWLLTHGMKLLMAKCLNLTEYMEALGNDFSRAIEKGMQEGLAAGIEHGQVGRCLTDLEAYIPSVEDDFNSAVSNLRGLNFSLLKEISNKKDASTWDIMDLLRLWTIRNRDVIGSQALSVALDICRGRVEKMERNLVERLPFLKDVFVSLDHPLSAEALIEPPVEVPATNVLSTMVIVPHSVPSVSVEDYENPDLVDVVPKNVTLGSGGEENIDAPTGGDLAFSKLDDEARDVVLIVLFEYFVGYSPGTGFAIPLMYFELIVRLLILLLYGITLMEACSVLGSSLPLRSFNLYDPFPSASVTSYGPSYLGPNFLVSSTRLASLLRSKLISNALSFLAMFTSAVLDVGIPIFAGMTASIS
ncbi:hypothetical protein Tco_0865625, partial [Tanacetum coccineum]